MGIQRIFKRAKERKDEAERVYVVTRASGKSFEVEKHYGRSIGAAIWRRTKEYREPSSVGTRYVHPRRER